MRRDGGGSRSGDAGGEGTWSWGGAAGAEAPSERAGRRQRMLVVLRHRYEDSLAHDMVTGLGTVEFGTRIVLFGASMLLSVLPLIILLSAFASRHVDDDISQHLGLNRQGARIVEGLFRSSTTTVSFGVLLSLLLSFVGTVAVARSVQTTYEQAFGHPARRGTRTLGRSVVWVVVVGGFVIGDAAVSRPLRDGPAGPVVLGLVDLAGVTLFFWWSMHYLLAGREPWGRLAPAALCTAVFWIGLGLFASLYFSSTVVSDSRLYGSVGVVFTLMTWFIAIGAVVALGPVVGVSWQHRRDRRSPGPGVPPGPGPGAG